MKLDVVLAFVAIMSAGLASAKTVAWWRFEGTPGATAPTEIANSVADSTIPALTAASIKTLKFGSDADFMPKFVAPSPKALKVYDPVSKSCVANASSLRLRDSREANPLKNGCAYTDAGKLPLKGDFTIECFFRIFDKVVNDHDVASETRGSTSRGSCQVICLSASVECPLLHGCLAVFNFYVGEDV